MIEQSAPEVGAKRIGPLDVLAFVVEIVAFLVVAVWGFVSWPFPVNVVIGILAPVGAIALWAIFLSPRSVLHIDPFGQAIVHIVVMGAAVFAWFDLGQPVVGVIFAVLAIVAGIAAGRKELS